MRNIRLTIQYDGAAYHGWQMQPGVDTIQQRLVEAVERLTGQVVRMHGSSRTDAGVHALGQVASFHIDCPVPTGNFVRALNNLLPDDIAVSDAVEMPPGFDAISDTKKKRYRYTICTSPIRPVMSIRYCWHRPGELDVAAMQAAAAVLVGTHDFKSFASAADQRQSSIRTILDCCIAAEGPNLHVEVEADGFLYNMVRNIVGTLVEVGRGRWTAADVQRILGARDRAAAGPIAPAGGLCLLTIDY